MSRESRPTRSSCRTAVTFSVADERGMGETSRSVGFLVDDVEEALAELDAVGIEPECGIARDERNRYVHV